MIVVHGFWASEKFQVWGEDSSCLGSSALRTPIDFAKLRPRKHPFACSADTLASALGDTGISDVATVGLPSVTSGPQPSLTLRQFDVNTWAGGVRRKHRLYPWNVPALLLEPGEALELLFHLTSKGLWLGGHDEVRFDDSLSWFSSIARLGLDIVANGRVLPAIVPTDGCYEARWRPVLTPEDNFGLQELQTAMPPSCRSSWSAVRSGTNSPSAIVRSVTEATVDAVTRTCSPALRPRTKGIRSSTALTAWLDALTSSDASIAASPHELAALVDEVDAWRNGAISASRDVRTCFRLVPPADEDAEANPDAPWILEVLLQSVRDPSMLVPASQVWNDNLDELLADSYISATEVLLRDLGRASHLYAEVELLLEEAQPEALELDTTLAVEFLQEAAPLLERAGFGVLLPSWWGSKRTRLNARLKTKSKSSSSTSSGLLGLNSLVDYQWEVALGNDKMTARELQRLAALKQPLVRVRGEWVLLNETDLEAALDMIKGGRSHKAQMTAGDALRIGLGLQDSGVELPVVDIAADGWLGDLLSADDRQLEEVPTPEAFEAELRPYQSRGLSWLDFHNRLGLGACLADDMGLGKTAQLLALLEHERQERSRPRSKIARGSTLVVCPMSLVGNWQREAERFAPKLRVHVHHGAGRVSGDNFIDAAFDADLVITTYQLVARDQQLLEQVEWQRVVLDEAQNIKNADATQAKAVRALPSARRIALTGTPVENRLSELWSIMEFLNPGLLGTATTFRKTFANPIERDHDDDAAKRLRRLTGPFILRRLKTDRSIISDLPEKLEIKTFCNLTREQASLYQAVVDDMLIRIDEAEGIQRKGLVLSTMLRLKQVCNHPVQFLSDGSRLSGRSGKLERLEEIIDEVLADDERVLVFTQFAEMGTMLRNHLQARLGEDVAWLHGGVPKKKRDAMVERFQAGDGPSVFLLSLKAGGTGLTLTAANHVVHFDRWWNPAVENQATDRAFRIGQKRNVQIRKFITVGTLEERIDQMIEQKQALAARIVGAGENWLTELSTAALRDVIALSNDAVGER